MEVTGDQVGLTCTYVYRIHNNNNNMYIGKVYIGTTGTRDIIRFNAPRFSKIRIGPSFNKD